MAGPRRELRPLLVAGVLVFLALALGRALDAEGTRVDLRAIAPVEARPGSTIGLRAFGYAEVGRPGGAELAALREGRARFEDESGEARGPWHPLSPSAAKGLEGTIPVPDALGAMRLRIEARVGETMASVTRTLVSTPDARDDLVYRPFREGQTGEVDVPASRERTIRGVHAAQGACHPETHCTLLLRTSGDIEALELLPSASVTPSGGADITPGLARVRVLTRGLEARVVARIRLADGAVRDEPLQLPIIVGGVGADLDDAGGAIVVEPFAGPAPAAVDRYVDGQWVSATSVGPGETSPLPPADAGSGVERFEITADPFARSGAEAVAYRRPSPDSDPLEEARARLGASLFADAEDALTLRLRGGHGLNGASPEAARAIARSLAARAIYPAPPIASSIEQHVTSSGDRPSWARILAALLVVALGAYFARDLRSRARAARQQAQAILVAARDEEDIEAASWPRSDIASWAIPALVFAAFIVVALAILFIGRL